MRYQLELRIDLPRERVIELFLDRDNLPKWQTSLVTFEHLSGEPSTVGAKSRQVHRMGSREVTMIETITTNRYPEEFSATYEAGKVWNLVENRFIDVDGRETRWILKSEFKCSGVMRIMTRVMPGMFKKQTLTVMQQFKTFVEEASRS